MLIDWQKIVLNLRTAGVSQTAIAKRINMDATNVRRLGNGEKEEPTFSQGMKLLDLHEALCPEKHKIELLTKRERSRLLVAA